VYPIKRKSNVLPIFKELKTQVELETWKTIKCIGYADNLRDLTYGVPLSIRLLLARM